MEMIVYILCALACFGCAALLIRGYRRNPSKLLLWSAVCFAGLTVNNVILCLDFFIGPTVDLSIVRATTGIVSMMALIYGLIWEVA